MLATSVYFDAFETMSASFPGTVQHETAILFYLTLVDIIFNGSAEEKTKRLFYIKHK
jgi:hypothetical protein